jgi:catechol 2,3-dioxygenase-like lactoylglutathione lyase family enzyme
MDSLKLSRRATLKLGLSSMAAPLLTKLLASQTKNRADSPLVDAKQIFDHILIGCADLDSAIAWFEDRTGVKPMRGGSHPGRGTRNALVSLGQLHYLELFAPDPAQHVANNELAELANITAPRPIAWAAHTTDVEAIRRRAIAAGLKLTGPTPGSRQRPHGRTLHWTTLDIQDRSSLVPFFIQWSADSRHPSADSPKGCSLAAIQFLTPNPDDLRRTLTALGIRADIQQASAPAIHITLSTPKGKLELK